MKYQNLISGEIRKHISKCQLLKILPSVLNIQLYSFAEAYSLEKKILSLNNKASFQTCDWQYENF